MFYLTLTRGAPLPASPAAHLLACERKELRECPLPTCSFLSLPCIFLKFQQKQVGRSVIDSSFSYRAFYVMGGGGSSCRNWTSSLVLRSFFCDPLLSASGVTHEFFSFSLSLPLSLWNPLISSALGWVSQPRALPFKWYTVSRSDSRAEPGCVSSDLWWDRGGPDCTEEGTERAETQLTAL